VEQYINQSTVIFKGLVEKTGASNLKILPASNQTILVRVEEVVSAAKTMIDLKGAQVTVQLKEPNALKVGDRATFFATGWLYGENVALQEVGHTSVSVNSEALRNQISDLQARKDDQKVQTRIQHATMVIAGRVLATGRFKGEGETKRNSEHDPDWWTADIKVQSYLKGQPAVIPSSVTVLFANSRDVMWVRSPKLKEGGQGIWVVTQYKPGGFLPKTRSPILAVLSSLDSYPLSESKRIARLVKVVR
jgi:hypothetical protein